MKKGHIVFSASKHDSALSAFVKMNQKVRFLHDFDLYGQLPILMFLQHRECPLCPLLMITMSLWEISVQGRHVVATTKSLNSSSVTLKEYFQVSHSRSN